ncbi:bifunctional 3-(3-hydroxy-phenyl)propionate/3-hydroxycinnamic acid hydroxylase [Subtercola boreus]|uniref:bifunctional 3-(3-hydroxy-phenyl)propionate/3-hydroxycinnamic acid hydroxylase MhpA n=1 Tax=Subtercola boreus TaxID=120213 RepID=UPI00116DFC8C|nr:bifunctional 3-(3-hydroxy-phenyl)propionate/3-hydroxycinnamic acid hydroxylase [Subtercola boreus]TQL52573.1 single-component resorcinol 4-hydroxylase [Subtercola boreus]
MKVDFLIVGAGPVGLLIAVLLGRDGWRVTVVERWPTRYPMPRACTIDHEALRILQSAGVMAEHSELFEPSRGERGGYQIRNGEGELLRAINWNRAAESGWANTNGFYQPDLEAVLESMASALPTVDVRRGWSATAVAQDVGTVTLTVARTGNEAHEETLVGSWLIGSDGANSAVRDLVGIDSVDSGFEADWLVVDYEPLDDREWQAFVTQYCDPEQPATAVNSGPGRRRFEFMRRADVTVDDLGRAETAWQLMAPWNVTPDNARLERHAVYTFRGRWANEWRRGRVLLAGDAAHLMPPFLGQGLCSGFRDASSLAWRLSLIESGSAGPALLDSYGSERSTHVREIIEAAIEIGRLVCELDPHKAAERDVALRSERNDPLLTPVEPPQPRLGEPSLTRSGDAWAGRLSVQARVEADGVTGLFDDVQGGRWQLVTLEADPSAAVPPDLARWFRSIGGTISSVSADGLLRDADGAYRTWFENHGCSVVLSRPDFYIYGTGLAADVVPLLESLRGALTSSLVPAQEGALS